MSNRPWLYLFIIIVLRFMSLTIREAKQNKIPGCLHFLTDYRLPAARWWQSPTGEWTPPLPLLPLPKTHTHTRNICEHRTEVMQYWLKPVSMSIFEFSIFPPKHLFIKSMIFVSGFRFGRFLLRPLPNFHYQTSIGVTELSGRKRIQMRESAASLG